MNGNKYKILIIEDDEHINIIGIFLRRRNDDVCFAQTGSRCFRSGTSGSGRNDFFKAVTERFP